jgi:hypothetical protein
LALGAIGNSFTSRPRLGIGYGILPPRFEPLAADADKSLPIGSAVCEDLARHSSIGTTVNTEAVMSREALALWKSAAMDQRDIRSSFAAPMHVLMSEAVDLIRFCRDYWHPVPCGESARPGLCEAGCKLPEHVADDLLVLQEALHTAHTEYLLTIPPVQAGLRTRAEFVLSELVAAIEWLLDDGQHDERDRQLSGLRQEHAPYEDAGDSLGTQLADYAALASQLRPRLAGLGGFNMSLIDDAHHLARELRQIGAGVAATEQTASALDLRNRIATLLVDRMTLVRAAACFVFRNHPAIARLAASTFDLRQRTGAHYAAADIEALVEKAAKALMA